MPTSITVCIVFSTSMILPSLAGHENRYGLDARSIGPFKIIRGIDNLAGARLSIAQIQLMTALNKGFDRGGSCLVTGAPCWTSYRPSGMRGELHDLVFFGG